MANKIHKPLDLEAMPPTIRDWLGSHALTSLIIDLNRRLGFTSWKRAVIPELILEIVIKEILPGQLIHELSENLNISPSSARIIAKEIEERMLKPIEKPLLDKLDIDIKQIYFGEPAAAEIPKTEVQPPQTPIQIPASIPKLEQTRPVQTTIETKIQPPEKPPIKTLPMPPTPPMIPKKEMTSPENQPKIVHYSSFKTPL